jgi:hypothetical protein
MSTVQGIYRIDTKFTEAKARAEACRQSERNFHTSQKFKEDREWYALGSARYLLKSAENDHPTYASFGTPPDQPDFITYSDGNKFWGKIEITEAMEAGRKPGDEFKQRRQNALMTSPKVPINPAYSLARYFPQLQAGITKKKTKRYAAETILLVWFNVPAWKVGFEEISSFSGDLMAGHTTNPFVDLNRFKRVLVLSACFGYMVELYPKVQAFE